jgi:hypothetical protein
VRAALTTRSAGDDSHPVVELAHVAPHRIGLVFGLCRYRLVASRGIIVRPIYRTIVR